MTACAYRSLEVVLEERVAALSEERAACAPRVDKVTWVVAGRIGKAVAGGVAVVFGASAFLIAISTLLAAGEGPSGLATIVLLGAWPAAWVAGTIGLFAARRIVSARLTSRVPSPRSVPELLLLEASNPLQEAKSLAARWETASAALPMAGLSLIAPLTFHWLAWCVLRLGQGDASSWPDFGGWMTLSVVIVGHAHVALAIAGVKWAFSLKTRETSRLRAGLHRSWTNALLAAIAMSCVPGIALMAVPPVLVWVTGLAFVPLTYGVIVRRIESERRVIEVT